MQDITQALSVTFEVRGHPPQKTETLSILSAGHRQAERVRTLLLAALLAVAPLLSARPARAATVFTVTTTGDRPDANPGDGVHPIAAEVLTDQPLRIAGEELRRGLEGRRFDEVPRRIVIFEKQLNFAAQSLVTVTTSLEESGSLIRSLLNRYVENIRATLPALRIHQVLPPLAHGKARP